MEHLRVDPEILKKRITIQIEDYNYTCLGILEDYLDISIFIPLGSFKNICDILLSGVILSS